MHFYWVLCDKQIQGIPVKIKTKDLIFKYLTNKQRGINLYSGPLSLNPVVASYTSKETETFKLSQTG